MSQLTAPELLELLKRNLPAVDHRGEVIEEIGESHLRMRLPINPSYLSQDLPAGLGQVVLSGPVMMGFADTAMYACVHAFYGSSVFAAMVSFNVSFFSVAGAGDLYAVARLLRKGKTLAFLEAHLCSGALSTPCAQVTATYAVRSIAGQQAQPAVQADGPAVPSGWQDTA